MYPCSFLCQGASQAEHPIAKSGEEIGNAMYRTIKVLLVLNLLALSAILARSFVVAPMAAAQSSTKVQDRDNQELVRLMDEDQADRTPDDAKSIDWKIVGPRDAARLSRGKELYSK